MDLATAVQLVRDRAGDDVLARLLAEIGEDESLFLSGSLVEGLGNRRSDLDLFIVGSTRPPDVPIRMAFAGDSWIDVEQVRPGQLDELGAVINHIDPEALSAIAAISREQLDRYYRFAIAVQLEGQFDAAARFSRGALRRVLAPWAVLHGGAYAARARIALRAGRLRPAHVYASHASCLALVAELTEVDELYPSLKYTLEKAIRAYGADAPEVTRAATLLFPDGDLVAYIERSLEHVAGALARCLPSLADGVGVVRTGPAVAVAADVSSTVPALLTRRAAVRILPEDAGVAAELLSLDELKSVDGQTVGDGPRAAEDAAQVIVLASSLRDVGLLTEVQP